ncbi:hypothetical protein D1872_304350 [compost metagenome]
MVKNHFHAVRFAVLLGNLLDVGIHEERNALLLHIFDQAVDEVLAYRGPVFRTVRAFLVHAARNRKIVQADADGIQPIDRFGGMIHEEAEHFLVIGAVTAF